MKPKDAHEFARRIAMRCPCCEQPIVLRGQHGSSQDARDDFLLAFKAWRECGALSLVTVEDCAQDIIDGSGEPVPGAL